MSGDKKVIENGKNYRFVPEFTTKRLPSGIYQPTYNANGQFILREASSDRTSNEDKKIERDIVKENPPFGDSNSETIDSNSAAALHKHEKNTLVDNNSKDEAETSVKTDEINAKWVNDGYFSLEKYNPELAKAEENISKFLNSKSHYEENDIDYKRSLLFFGPPGTGKSQYVSNKCYELIRNLDAVVVRLETHADVEIFAEDGMREIADGLPERFKIVVFEELSEITKHDQIKQFVVNILDNNQLRHNVLFMATTNEPHLLPKNFVDRPGRLDFLHGIKAEENDPSYIPKFYEHLIGEEYPVDNPEWTGKIATELTPAYVKGLFITAKERNEGLKETYERIKERRKLVQNDFKEETIGY